MGAQVLHNGEPPYPPVKYDILYNIVNILYFTCQTSFQWGRSWKHRASCYRVSFVLSGPSRLLELWTVSWGSSRGGTRCHQPLWRFSAGRPISWSSCWGRPKRRVLFPARLSRRRRFCLSCRPPVKMQLKFCIYKNNELHFEFADQTKFEFWERNAYHTIETVALLSAPVELLIVVFWKSTRGLQCTVCINLTNKYNTYRGKFAVKTVNPQSHVSKMEPLLDEVCRLTHLIWTW